MPKPIKDERSPYWQYDFQRNKRRFYGSTGCTAKRDAQTFIDNLVRKIALGQNERPEITLDDACQAYWRDKGQHERSSKATDYWLSKLCEGIGQKKLLSAISLQDFRTYVAKRRAYVSNASVNREWQLARRVWNHVGETHAVSTIKWGDLKLPEPKERVRELSADEETRLFEALPDDLKPVIEFAILSGQRRAAIIGLRWDKIDWANGEATVINKGGQPHTFPLSPRLIHLLIEQPQLDECPTVFSYKCERPSPKRKDRPARRKGVRYPFSEEGWSRKWMAALKAAGITDFRFHDLRHTSATRVMRQTGNLKAVSHLLGHTDIRTTSRYAHVGKEDLREIMNATESRNNTGKRLIDPPIKLTNTE